MFGSCGTVCNVHYYYDFVSVFLCSFLLFTFYYSFLLWCVCAIVLLGNFHRNLLAISQHPHTLTRHVVRHPKHCDDFSLCAKCARSGCSRSSSSSLFSLCVLCISFFQSFCLCLILWYNVVGFVSFRFIPFSFLFLISTFVFDFSQNKTKQSFTCELQCRKK